MQVTQDPGECKLTVTALPHANCGEAPLPPCQVDWVSPAPGYARGRTATVFFCDWEGCTSVWPHPNPAQTWAIISEPPSYYCTFAPELLHACPLFRSPFRRVHRRPCLPACMHACLPACLPACCCSPAPQSCDLSLTFMFCCTDGTLSEDGQQIPWPRACGMGCVTVGNWTRGAGPAPAPPMPPKPPKGDWPGACCAASAFGCGVAPQKCGPTECTPTPWVNCTDGKPKYCIDCGFPPCPNSTQC